MKESQRDVKKSPRNGKNRGQRKQIFIVTSILLIILGANLGIYLNYKNNIKTNYFSLPKEEENLFYKEPIVIFSLEQRVQKEIKEGSDLSFYRIGIMENKTDEVHFTQYQYWKVNKTDQKYLYYANFSFIFENPTVYKPLETNKSYRFFIHFRSWFSPYFQVMNESLFYFEWV